MRLRLGVRVAALAWVLLPLGTLQHAAFEVSVRPPAPVVEYGGSVELNCTTTCRDPNAPGGLETSLTKKPIGNGTGWRAFRLVNIMEWESKALCYFNCDKESKQMKATITTYHAPEHVTLEALTVMQEGRNYSLTCRVLKVAPIRNLTVILLRGAETLYAETYQNYSVVGLQTVTVTHAITAQRQDHGKEVTCRAVLDLTPHGQRFENTSRGVVLQIFAFQDKPLHHVENWLLRQTP